MTSYAVLGECDSPGLTGGNLSLESTLEAKLLSIEGKLRDFDYPPQIVIENTSRCNQQCIHCSHKELIRPKRPMERALWDKIVIEIGREAPHTEIWPLKRAKWPPAGRTLLSSCGPVNVTSPLTP